MQKFDLTDRFKLELRWSSVKYEQDGRCRMEGAYFTGPALADALQLEANDHIMLDFFKQYLVLVENVYIGKFSWGQVEYKKDGSIDLTDTYLTHDTELNKVPQLKDTDYLIIDTSNHEVETHPFNPVYRTYVVNGDTSLYKFGGK